MAATGLLLQFIPNLMLFLNRNLVIFTFTLTNHQIIKYNNFKPCKAFSIVSFSVQDDA